MKLQTCLVGAVAAAITTSAAHAEFIHSNRHVGDAQAKVVEIYYKNGNQTLHDHAYTDALYATLSKLKAAMPHMYCVDPSRSVSAIVNHQVSTQGSTNEKAAAHSDASYHAVASNVPSVAVGNYTQSDSHRATLPPPFRYSVADDGGFGDGNSSAGNQRHMSSPFRENGQGRSGANGDRSDGNSNFGLSGQGGNGSHGNGRFGPTNAAPEPTSLAMFAIGALVLGGMGFRRANPKNMTSRT